jgi:dolichol-phosphate mannosyltransferase
MEFGTDEINPKACCAMKGKKMISVSVVIPAKNEAENIPGLVGEIRSSLGDRFDYEIIYIDDGSTDSTLPVLERLRQECPCLRVWSHQASAGQSRAVYHGVRLARYPIVATLDADGQNDPADIPGMVEKLVGLNTAGPADGAASHVLPSIFDAPGKTALVAGHRKHRRDTWLKRISSKIANGFRGWVLKDRTPDTGCGLKVFYREVFLYLPYFDHMHRFIPALMRRAGYSISNHEVNHRPRRAGVSKYGLHDRLWVGIVDIFGVIWLNKRCRAVQLLQGNNDE